MEFMRSPERARARVWVFVCVCVHVQTAYVCVCAERTGRATQKRGRTAKMKIYVDSSDSTELGIFTLSTLKIIIDFYFHRTY